MNRWRTVWPFPLNLALKGEATSLPAAALPMGLQPEPAFQYASPASGPPLPLVSKSRSASSSYPRHGPMQRNSASSSGKAWGKAARYAAAPASAGTPSPLTSCRIASSCASVEISISPSLSRS